ncbi:putative OsmC-like protein [Flavobacterium sp. 7E]|uniref:OsmC family protein n=1 Tax=Flavobacterium sp. 7E TaxID=2735898 RepID=UPI00156E1F45|nr:OsmC family protein [Flavobacterium sp. 7E]NRS87918.1 putative OsmC-like protein [Flavobacterium sp. 7E]
MNYSVNASISAIKDAEIHIKDSEIIFGISPDTEASLPNPAELFLGSLSACILKNVARFSVMMKFEYTKAELTIIAVRLDKPPRMDEIQYELVVYSQDESLNIDLLQKNIEKFGTIYNTVKLCCSIRGTVKKITD